LCTLSVAVLATGGVASAGRACNLLKDADNDVTVLGPPGVLPPVPALDIKSADVATGAKKLVVIMRLASTDFKASQFGPFGVEYQLQFVIGDVTHSFSHKLNANGSTYTDTATVGGTPISGLSMKVTGTTITWTVPRTAVPSLKPAKKKAVLTGFFAKATSTGAHDYAPDDSRPSTNTYTDRTPSCLAAG
jgi:hypothetical protein